MPTYGPVAGAFGGSDTRLNYTRLYDPRPFPPAALPNPTQRQNFYPWFVTFTINGFSHGSLPLDAYTVQTGQKVRWYLMSSTNDFDFHAPH